MSVSAVIIAENEELMLPGCLASLGFADEVVVVVGAGSTDRTAALARRAGARVFIRKFDTFAKQKGFGVRKATGDWVLAIDADERVSRDLAARIPQAIREDAADGYWLTIVSTLFGQELHHGGWTFRNLRLIRRRFATYTGDVHERFTLPKDRIGRLPGEIQHFSHRSPADTLKKTALYADLWADQMIREQHPPVRARTLLARPAKALWRRLVRHRGYRDGIAGVIAAGFDAFGLFYFYTTLWSKQRQPSLDETYRRLDRRSRKRPRKSR